MMDGQTALIQAHRNNIRRYQRLLKTRLTNVERQYIEARLSEEQAALATLPSINGLASAMLSAHLTTPDG